METRLLFVGTRHHELQQRRTQGELLAQPGQAFSAAIRWAKTADHGWVGTAEVERCSLKCILYPNGRTAHV